ncbi:hypothetical protein D3C75_1016400 [compost metagenome]
MPQSSLDENPSRSRRSTRYRAVARKVVKSTIFSCGWFLRKSPATVRRRANLVSSRRRAARSTDLGMVARSNSRKESGDWSTSSSSSSASYSSSRSSINSSALLPPISQASATAAGQEVTCLWGLARRKPSLIPRLQANSRVVSVTAK